MNTKEKNDESITTEGPSSDTQPECHAEKSIIESVDCDIKQMIAQHEVMIAAASPNDFAGASDEPVHGDPFFCHVASPECRRKLYGLVRSFRGVREQLMACVAPGGVRNKAVDKLHDAMMSAVAACVLNDPNSKPEA